MRAQVQADFLVKINKFIVSNPLFCISLTAQNFFHGSVSPMHLLRDSTSNARWLEDNINDFSLTSLLGHLDEIDATRDILVRVFHLRFFLLML